MGLLVIYVLYINTFTHILIVIYFYILIYSKCNDLTLNTPLWFIEEKQVLDLFVIGEKEKYK